MLPSLDKIIEARRKGAIQESLDLGLLLRIRLRELATVDAQMAMTVIRYVPPSAKPKPMS